MKAIVKTMIARLHAEPNESSELIDEVLYGMTVEILEENHQGWVLIQTEYRYEGFCKKEDLLLVEETSEWLTEAKHVICQNFADILTEPRIQSGNLTTVVRGSVIRVVTSDDHAEWEKVELVTGEVGYTRKHWLQPKVEQNYLSEQQFRDQVVQSALSYLTTPYRWGGKSPLGIDCSGLCSMAYMLNGVYIYRDAKIVEGFPIKEISMDNIQKGDLLYFPGHIAMYMGDDLYVHSSLGGNEVSINSLNEAHPHYRKDLATTITAVGSFFA